MNRRGFFGRLAGAVVAAFVAPRVVAPASPVQWKSAIWFAPHQSQRIWFSDPAYEAVRLAYRDSLGREATDVEIRAWLSAKNNG